MKQIIAKFLKEKREKSGISIYKLAQLTGCGRMMIARIESGECAPNSVLFFTICKELNVSISALNGLYRKLKE